MSKNYRYKQFKEQDSRDTDSANYIRKSLNSSERLKAKREIQEELQDFPILPTKIEVMNMKWDLSDDFAVECARDNRDCPSNALCLLLCKLNVVPFRDDDIWYSSYHTGQDHHFLFKCKCPSLSELSDQEIMRLSGL